MDNQFPYRAKDRFQVPKESGQVVSPYDYDSRLFQDLDQRGINPAYVQSINLGTAGEMLINVPGFHFVIYGNDGSTIKTVNTTAYVNAYINKKTPTADTPFPAKHARGFSGPFASLYLTWPAQTSGGNPVYADLIIFKSIEKPWIDGESGT